MAIKVMKSGLLTTIQDSGRKGYQAFGFPVGGSMDQMAAKLANIVLGNDENEAVLEMTMIGPTLQFESDALISLFGADMSPTLNVKLVRHGKPIQVKSGDTLKFGHAKKGTRCYLSVKGGFSIPHFLQSKSAYIPAGIGVIVKSDDFLPIKESLIPIEFRWGLANQWESYITQSDPIRFIRGRQYDWFTDESIRQFSQSPSPKSQFKSTLSMYFPPF